MLRSILAALERLAVSLGDLTPKLVAGLAVIVVFIVIAKIFKAVAHGIVERTKFDSSLGALIGRLTSAIIIVVGIFAAAVVIFPAFHPGDLIAGLGLTSVLIGFAFKDILQNFFAGLLILWRRPFRVGDEIVSREFAGRVEDINMRSTRIRTYDGERAVLPNSDVYTSPIVVRTAYPLRRSVVTIGIGYGDSIELARKIIFDVLNRNEGVARDPCPWVYTSDLASSSVDLKVYYWTATDQASVLQVGDQVLTSIKTELMNAGIDIPYPHQVVLLEGRDPNGEAARY